jgi:hypothetical protein
MADFIVLLQGALQAAPHHRYQHCLTSGEQRHIVQFCLSMPDHARLSVGAGSMRQMLRLHRLPSGSAG